jgi:hypothetical protein
VRQVEHVHQSEDDRKAGGQQKDEAAESQAVDDQLKGGADGERRLTSVTLQAGFTPAVTYVSAPVAWRVRQPFQINQNLLGR